jgi:hypothetical protein
MTNKNEPLKARVKVRLTLYDNLGYAFQQLANLYQLDYDKLAERLIFSGVESHLHAINELQTKQQESQANADQQANQPSGIVSSSGTPLLPNDPFLK